MMGFFNSIVQSRKSPGATLSLRSDVAGLANPAPSIGDNASTKEAVSNDVFSGLIENYTAAQSEFSEIQKNSPADMNSVKAESASNNIIRNTNKNCENISSVESIKKSNQGDVLLDDENYRVLSNSVSDRHGVIDKKNNTESKDKFIDKSSENKQSIHKKQNNSTKKNDQKVEIKEQKGRKTIAVSEKIEAVIPEMRDVASSSNVINEVKNTLSKGTEKQSVDMAERHHQNEDSIERHDAQPVLASAMKVLASAQDHAYFPNRNTAGNHPSSEPQKSTQVNIGQVNVVVETSPPVKNVTQRSQSVDISSRLFLRSL